jgi:GR25 family glycosyltransferase involved in LPS biosynthesis
MLNDFFDKIYCINLDKRVDRWEESSKVFEKYNIKVERISAIDGSKLQNNSQIKSGALALTLTVYNVITDAIKNKCEKILILEDDIEFTDNILNFTDTIKHLPDDWDLLYFGGNHNIHAGETPPVKVNNFFNKLHNTYSTHAIGVSSSGLKIISDKLNGDLKEIDVMYADLQKTNNVYCFNELTATQRISFSDIENVVTNYQNIIK